MSDASLTDKLAGAVLLLGIAATLLAQAPAPKRTLYAYIGSRYLWLTIGPTLTVSAANQLDTVSGSRTYGRVLIYEPVSRAWTLPPGAANLAVFVNGVRYTVGVDYEIVNGRITPRSGNMPADSLVLADYEAR